MEFRDYLAIIGKRIRLLIGVIFIVTLATYIFSVRIPTKYDASTSINVAVKSESQLERPYYDYDNYYAIQASSLFADTIINWLRDPSNVIEINKNVGLDLGRMSLKKLSKMISVKKKSPSTIVITFSSPQKDQAEAFANQVVKFLEAKTTIWSAEGLMKNVHLVASSPIVLEHQSPVLVNSLLGLLTGFILGLAIIFLSEYFSKER